MNKLFSASKRLLPYVLILLFSIFGTWLFMYNGLNIGDDYYFHLPSILDKYESVISGNGLGGISSEIGNGIGYGASLYYSPLSHYFIVILALVFKPFGISLMTSYKLAFIFVVFLLGVFMYRFALKFTHQNKVASLISSACLILYPYRLFNLFCRLAIAEAFAFTFVPLFLCGLYEITHTKEIKILPFVKIVFGASLLFLSHNLTALFVFIVGALYLIIYIPRLIPLFKRGRFWIYAGASVFLIVGTCAIALFPQLELMSGGVYAITDSGIMRTDVSHVISHVGKEWYYSGFLNVSFLQGLGHSSSSLYTGIILFALSCLIFVVLDMVLAKIPVLKIAHYFISAGALFIMVSLAYARLEIYLATVVFLFLYVFISIHKDDYEEQGAHSNGLFWFCSVGGLLTICIMASTSFWENAPDFLLKIQFPWRLWSLVQIFASILVGLMASHFAKRKIALCVISVFVGLLLILNMPILEKRSEGQDEWQSEITLDYLDNISALGHHKEYAPTIFQQKDYVPKENSLYYDVKAILYGNKHTDLAPVFLSGDGSITVISKNAPQLEMEITVNSDAEIQLPLIYYKGYKIIIDDEKINADCTDGLVSFELSSGTYRVKTAFVGSGLRICGRILTAICSILSLSALGYGIYAETGIRRLFKRSTK